MRLLRISGSMRWVWRQSRPTWRVKTELDDFRQETRATFRSVDEQLAEIKDLIIGRPGA